MNDLRKGNGSTFSGSSYSPLLPRDPDGGADCSFCCHSTGVYDAFCSLFKIKIEVVSLCPESCCFNFFLFLLCCFLLSLVTLSSKNVVCEVSLTIKNLRLCCLLVAV